MDILTCGVSPAGVDACATLSISGKCRLRFGDGVSVTALDDTCFTSDDPSDSTCRCELRFLADGTLGKVCTTPADAQGANADRNKDRGCGAAHA